MSEYKSYYVWQTEAFPFRVYYEGKNLRIFIIENLQHNYEWLSKFRFRIRPSDFFFVILGTHWDESLVNNADQMFDYLDLDKNKFFIMYNDARDKALFSSKGFEGDIINQNAWLDYNGIMTAFPEEKIIKKYDALYVGRLIRAKRHYLARRIKNLALVCGPLWGEAVSEPAPKSIYRNAQPLSPREVCMKINQSYCGVILSEKEGACFASSEYLLCGIPVVSTYSEGGRSEWYNNYNSIVVPPHPDEIACAVQEFVSFPRDASSIRADHIEKSKVFRLKFVDKLAGLFKDFGEKNIDAMAYFDTNYIHKMRTPYAPNFEEIFKVQGNR